MGRGRPSKPAALKDLEGDKGKGRRPAFEDMALSGLPECPDTLDSVAAEHFELVSAELATVNVVKRIDSEAMSVLGSLWSDFWRADEMLRKAETKDDFDERKLAMALKYKAYAAWAQLAAKFCLTPVDRLKIVASGAKPETNPTEERFLKITG
jgi:phage terminase small subunit